MARKGISAQKKANGKKRKGIEMNEHMKISEETIEEMKRTVKEVIRTFGMEIDNGDMIAHEREFTYDLELKTGYGWRILQIWATLEPDGVIRMWATSHRPGSMGSREESEDDEIEILCKNPVKGIADAVRYALIDHVTPEMKRILEERTRMKSPTEGLMELKRDAQRLLDKVDEQMRRFRR